MKKMVILGNGFDLGGELPTKYENYFEYYKSANSEVLAIIEEFINLEKKTEIDFSLRYDRSSEEYSLRESEISKNINAYTEAISKRAIDKNISIWNLHFLHSYKLEKNNWSDVESEIFQLIKGFSTITFINPYEKISDIERKLSALIKKINCGNPRSTDPSLRLKYSQNIFFLFEKEDRFKYICDYILMKRYGTECESDYLSILKRELVLFEENFREYIADISKNQINEENYLDLNCNSKLQ